MTWVTTLMTGHSTLVTFSRSAWLSLRIILLNYLRFHLHAGLAAARGVQLLWGCFHFFLGFCQQLLPPVLQSML